MLICIEIIYSHKIFSAMKTKILKHRKGFSLNPIGKGSGNDLSKCLLDYSLTIHSHPFQPLDACLNASATARRLKLYNVPECYVICNMLNVLSHLYDELRKLYDEGLLSLDEINLFEITSMYRSPEVNSAVGGALNSLHLCGLAFDITAPSKVLKKLFDSYASYFEGTPSFNASILHPVELIAYLTGDEVTDKTIQRLHIGFSYALLSEKNNVLL